MRVPFQAIHVSWAHAFPIYCDVPDLHILRTFFASGKTVAYPARMETCCRASVVLLDCVPNTKSNEQTYTDILALACRNGLYVVSPLGLFPNRQMWVNRTNKSYYPCPDSEIVYTQLVECYNEDEIFPEQQNNQLRPLGTSQSQNTMHNHRRPHNSGRGRGSFNRGTARRFRGRSQGVNGNTSNANQNGPTRNAPKPAKNSSNAKELVTSNHPKSIMPVTAKVD